MTQANDLDIVILAAGQGTRMRSSLPKVLHPLAGKSLLKHVVDTAESLQPKQVHIIYGHGGDTVKSSLTEYSNLNWVEQTERLGTGHAVKQALPHLSKGANVLVLYGDVPLVNPESLQLLCSQLATSRVALLTAVLDDPTGLGRIIRDQNNKITAIVEHKDATKSQLKVDEIFSGILAVNQVELERWLPALSNHNAQREYYLTDIVAMAVEEGLPTSGVVANCPEEVQGINDKLQLAQLERYFQQRKATELMQQGVTLLDPSRFDLRGNLTVGADVIFDINVIIEGNVRIGSNCSIGPNVVLKDTILGNNITIHANSVVDGAKLGDNAAVGPFSRIRPKSELADGAEVGNFVEVNRSLIGPNSKAKHLTYLGDAVIGTGANIGAGTITCNYDGANKHKTEIQDNAFIGSGVELVAPVTIGENATIGAGSTITKNVAATTLSVARSRQSQIDNWQRPQKKK